VSAQRKPAVGDERLLDSLQKAERRKDELLKPFRVLKKTTRFLKAAA